MTSRIQQTVSRYRQLLLAREATASQALEDAYARVLEVIQPELERLYSQMTGELAQGGQISLSWLYEANRLETLKKLLTGQIDQFGALSNMIVGRLQTDGIQLGLDAALALLDATVPPGISWSFGVPSMDALHSLIGATQAGSPLADLFRGFGQEAARAAGKALIVGVSLGKGPREIAPQIEKAIGEPRWRALTIARTEALRSYRTASLETYRKNSDVVGQWRWTAALQKRTCAACLAMDGTLHPLTQEFGSHPNCRCTPVPLTKEWAEILGPLGIDTSSIPDTRPQMQSGSDWFQSQNEATQRTVLGNAKYEAWKAGKFELADTVKKTYDPDWGSSIQERSLKELVK